jgi:hypothetical protein
MFGRSGPTLSLERQQRFDADRALLAELVPELRHYIWAHSGNAFAEGPAYADVGAGCFEPVMICMRFGPRYPSLPPTVYDIGRRWKPTADRHINDDSSFCLWLPNVDRPDVGTPVGFRDFLLRLFLFLRDQFVYDDLGRWPGPAWPHGATDAYAHHVVERLGLRDETGFRRLWPLITGTSQRPDRRCPCGSQLSYQRCHRSEVERLRWLGRRADRDEIARSIEAELRVA